MKILLDTSTGEEGPCLCLLVDIDEDTKKEILEQREVFQMAHSRISCLYSITSWGIPGEFYEDLYRENFEELLTEEQLKTFEDQHVVVLPDDFTIEADFVRTECDMTVITQDNFYWKAYVKHCDITIESEALKYDLLLGG